MLSANCDRCDKAIDPFGWPYVLVGDTGRILEIGVVELVEEEDISAEDDDVALADNDPDDFEPVRGACYCPDCLIAILEEAKARELS